MNGQRAGETTCIFSTLSHKAEPTAPSRMDRNEFCNVSVEAAASYSSHDTSRPSPPQRPEQPRRRVLGARALPAVGGPTPGVDGRVARSSGRQAQGSPRGAREAPSGGRPCTPTPRRHHAPRRGLAGWRALRTRRHGRWFAAVALTRHTPPKRAPVGSTSCRGPKARRNDLGVLEGRINGANATGPVRQTGATGGGSLSAATDALSPWPHLATQKMSPNTLFGPAACIRSYGRDR